MAKRRKLEVRKDTDWEALVKECLTGAHTFKWGCLNKSNRLFRISTFKSIMVPSKIVNRMQRAGRLVLNEGYYNYVPPRQKRTL